MCGDDFHEEIEAARVSPGPAYAGPINPLGPPAAGDGRTSENTPGNEEGLEREESGEGAEGENARTPGVSPIPHVAQPPSEFRKLIVRKVQRAAGKASGRRQMVDGDKCEKMALAFEEQSDPPRFALGVGHITGKDAPGFDLVSFDSSKDRDVFQIPETRDWSKVRRFIEVKGRSSSTARIDLKGNELNAASVVRPTDCLL